jgi:hypothetical protein
MRKVSQTAKLLRLLKEYTEKLDSIMLGVQNADLTRLKSLKSEPHNNYLRWVNGQKQYVLRMAPECLDLVRIASQLVDHSELTDIDRASVKIRMEDLQATVQKVQQFMLQHN